MMKYACSLMSVVILFFAGAYASADSALAKAQNPALAIMEKASAHYQDSVGLEAEFESSVYWSALEEWRSSKGTLRCRGGTSFHVTLPEMEIVSNGAMVWKYSRENGQVIIESVGEGSPQYHPSRLILDFLGCEPLEMSDIEESGQKYYRISLNPGHRFRHYDSISVLIEKKTCGPFRIKTVDDAENVNIYTIRSLKHGISFKDSDFILSPPEGAEVIDLRE